MNEYDKTLQTGTTMWYVFRSISLQCMFYGVHRKMVVLINYRTIHKEKMTTTGNDKSWYLILLNVKTGWHYEQYPIAQYHSNL